MGSGVTSPPDSNFYFSNLTPVLPNKTSNLKNKNKNIPPLYDTEAVKELFLAYIDVTARRW